MISLKPEFIPLLVILVSVVNLFHLNICLNRDLISVKWLHIWTCVISLMLQLDSYTICVQALSASKDKVLQEMFPEAELLSQKRPPTVRAKLLHALKTCGHAIRSLDMTVSFFLWVFFACVWERLGLSLSSVSMNWWRFSCPRNHRTFAASSQMTGSSPVSKAIPN